MHSVSKMFLARSNPTIFLLQTLRTATPAPAMRFTLALLLVVAATCITCTEAQIAKISLYKAPALSPCHSYSNNSTGKKSQQTYVRDPLDCSLFYTCFGNRFWKMSCTTPGTVYSLQFKVCVWRNSVFDDCTNGQDENKEEKEERLDNDDDDDGDEAQTPKQLVVVKDKKDAKKSFYVRNDRLESKRDRSRSQNLKTKGNDGRQESVVIRDDKSKGSSPFKPKKNKGGDPDRNGVDFDPKDLNSDREIVESDREGLESDHKVVDSDRKGVNPEHKIVDTDRKGVNPERKGVDLDRKRVDSDRERVDSDRFVDPRQGPDDRNPPPGLKKSKPRLDNKGQRLWWHISPDGTQKPPAEHTEEDRPTRLKGPTPTKGTGPDSDKTSEDLNKRDRAHNDDKPKRRQKFRYPPKSPVVPNRKESIFTRPAPISDVEITTTTTATTTTTISATSTTTTSASPPTAATTTPTATTVLQLSTDASTTSEMTSITSTIPQGPDTTKKATERSPPSSPWLTTTKRLMTAGPTRETTASPPPTNRKPTPTPQWRIIPKTPKIPRKAKPSPSPPPPHSTPSPMTSQRPLFSWKRMTSPRSSPRQRRPPSPRRHRTTPTPPQPPPTTPSHPRPRAKQHDDRNPRNPYLKYHHPFPQQRRQQKQQQHHQQQKINRRRGPPHTRREGPTLPPRRRGGVGPTAPPRRRRPVFTPGPQWWSEKKVSPKDRQPPRYWKGRRGPRPTAKPTRPRGSIHLKLRTTPEPVRWWKPTTQPPSLWQQRRRFRTPAPTRRAPPPPPRRKTTTTTTTTTTSTHPSSRKLTTALTTNTVTTTMSSLREVEKTPAQRPRVWGTTRSARTLTMSTTPTTTTAYTPLPPSSNTTMTTLTSLPTAATPIKTTLTATAETITLPHRAQMAEHCGIMARPMIIGGQPSRPGQWPWQVSLQIIAAIEPWHRCGGVLIHQSWVLTAAHCVEGPFYGDVRNWRVVLAEDNLEVESGREIYRRVARIISHPGYIRTSNFPNDVALLQLDEGVDLSTGEVRVACLPDQNTPPPDLSHCWISGWGETRGSGGHENAMNELPVRLLDNEDCASMWLRVGIHVLDDQLCVGYGDTGACYGDSGGPLMCEQDGRYYTTGVMSWLINNCSARGFPNVFTRVTSYLDWIYERLDFYEWWRYN